MVAKTDKEQLKAYKKAKRCYTAADYRGAQTALELLIEAEKKTAITPYALFYYALAAYHQGAQELAEGTFSRIIQEFSAWEQLNEVLYWLSQLRFEQADYVPALNYLAQITDISWKKSIRNIKVHFLQQIEQISTLQVLLRQYPKDKTIAQVLLDRLSEQPFIKQDHDLITTLVQRFNLAFRAHDPFDSILSSKKDSYNVAVFFPFFIDEVDYEEENSNQFVLELYKGIQAAVAALASQGITVNLFAYDTKKNATITAALLAQEEVKSMDLIIGPLYAATIPLVADFAREHQINLFNPLSVNANVVGTNPFVYLFKPSLETQARRAAVFTQQHTQTAHVGIVYGTSPEDSIKAYTYKQYIEHNTSQDVALMLQLKPEASQQFLSAFRGVGSVHVAKPHLDSLTHIYIASQDKLIIANVLSTIEIMNLNPCIIGDEAWLKQNSITLDQLQRLQLRLVAPDYIDYEKESLYAFRRAFYGQFGHYPTYYAAVGYDMMLFLGTMLAQHGAYFQKCWEKKPTQGAIFSGFAYGRHHDNQHVPIVKFQESALVVCNEAQSDGQ
ncbi:MAG: hypothetical protein AAF392_01275 [Bacteroidota bacterium]